MKKVERFLNSGKWMIKQVLPLTYRSHYKEGSKQMFSVWKMWFGRVFDHEKFKVRST